MHFVLSILAALAVATALVLGSRMWFGKVMKRRHAQDIGIDALSARHWRDALTLIVDALGRDGLTAQAELGVSQGPSLGERILRRGASTVLLIYKHGTAYCIGAPALRDAEKRRQEAGIDEVVIATLGTIDAEARRQAARMRITCHDGAAVWAMVGESLDPGTRSAIEAEAEQRIDRPRRLSTIGAGVLGFAIVFWGASLDQHMLGFVAVSSAPEVRPFAKVEATTNAVAAGVASAPSTPAHRAPAPVAAVAETPAEQRRAALAKAIGGLAEVDGASWSSSSTLVLSVNARASIEEAQAQTCALVAEYPELRDIRLQFEAGGGSDVRWRRCA